MSDKPTRYQPHPDAAYRDLQGHVFVITADSRQHELSGEVDVLVWRLCSERPRSRDELLRAILDAFDVDSTTAASDLDQFLRELLGAAVFAEAA